MIETLPEPMQVRAVDHLREYIGQLADEQAWDESFRQTRPQLAAAAVKARAEIAAGLAKPLNPDEL